MFPKLFGALSWIVFTLLLSACGRTNLPRISQLTPDYNMPWNATILAQGKPQISIVTALPFTPTATPTLTPTPMPDAVVLMDTINVRSGPGSGYSIA